MRTTLEPEDIQAIAMRVVEMLKPLLRKEEDDELLNIDQVSALLGKSKEQVYQWVHNAKYGMGDFPYKKAGKALRFSKKDLCKWMKPALENR
jgi:excisionase family DNA binding protein